MLSITFISILFFFSPLVKHKWFFMLAFFLPNRIVLACVSMLIATTITFFSLHIYFFHSSQNRKKILVWPYVCHDCQWVSRQFFVEMSKNVLQFAPGSLSFLVETSSFLSSNSFYYGIISPLWGLSIFNNSTEKKYLRKGMKTCDNRSLITSLMSICYWYCRQISWRFKSNEANHSDCW